MRILIVSSEEQESGGVASVIRNLAQYLHDHGHQLTFLYSGTTLAPKRTATKLGFPGFEINLRLPFGEERNPFLTLTAFLLCFPISMYQLIRFIQNNSIEIVNIHYAGDCWFYFALCRRILSFGLVTSVHGADLFPGGRPMPRYSRAIKLLLNLSDRVIAPSQSFRRDVSTVFPRIANRTMAIHNSVDLAELNGTSSQIAKNREDPYVLCIAMHNEKKGLDVLLRAFALVQNELSTMKLVLVGDGPLREELEYLASSLKIRAKVHFLGTQGRTQVRELLHRCEMLVLPSRSEPFGIVILEAMACRKPVVSTRVGGIPEIIEHGKNGILVEPEDPKALAEALLAVSKNNSVQAALGTHGYDTVRERFRSENTGAAYEITFNDILGSRRADAFQAELAKPSRPKLSS